MKTHPKKSRSTRSWRILLVDDDRDVRELLANILEAHGHEVHRVRGGPCGLQLLTTTSVDLVITDLQMPEMDGWSVATEVRRRFPNLKVGMVTSWSGAIGADQLTAHGVEFLWPKPFDLDAIRRTMRTLA